MIAGVALDPDLTIVVPTRNKAQNVEELVRGTEAAMAGASSSWELLLVDDSDDDTPARARLHAAAGSPVRVPHRKPGKRTDGLSGAVLPERVVGRRAAPHRAARP